MCHVPSIITASQAPSIIDLIKVMVSTNKTLKIQKIPSLLAPDSELHPWYTCTPSAIQACSFTSSLILPDGTYNPSHEANQYPHIILLLQANSSLKNLTTADPTWNDKCTKFLEFLHYCLQNTVVDKKQTHQPGIPSLSSESCRFPIQIFQPCLLPTQGHPQLPIHGGDCLCLHWVTTFKKSSEFQIIYNDIIVPQTPTLD